MIFISREISFTWTLNFSKASVGAQIDKRSRELNTEAHEQAFPRAVRGGGNRSHGADAAHNRTG